jgi:hypothetical protein
MLPGNADLVAYRGDSWSQVFRFKQNDVPVNLTGATIAAWARDTDGTVLHFNVANGGSNGQVTLSFPTPAFPPGSYRYDVEVTLGGVISTWVRGQLRIEGDITNAA